MKFRWLPYREGNAAWNMAVDEAILEAHLQGLVPTTLRFYGWSPPAVSLGYAQRIDEKVVKAIVARGLNVVRRPTGGRAVLHQGDLTYSFVGSSSDSSERSSIDPSSDSTSNSKITSEASRTRFATLPSGVADSYLQICHGLINGLTNLGLQAEIGRGKGGYNRFQDCFQSTTSADLQVNGLKIVGSAQLRRKHAVLQHGSILLNQDQQLMSQLLEIPVVSASARHCNVFDLIDEVPIEQIERAFLEGFCDSNGQRFEGGKLTDFELSLADSLLKKYAIAS